MKIKFSDGNSVAIIFHGFGQFALDQVVSVVISMGNQVLRLPKHTSPVLSVSRRKAGKIVLPSSS